MSDGISIHAPRTGSDLCARKEGSHDLQISIHAPRTGSDFCRRLPNLRRQYFNPRSPHGERRDGRFASLVLSVEFQSTLPARGATNPDPEQSSQVYSFQSTLPARGATRDKDTLANYDPFQSTLPARGATLLLLSPGASRRISIHAPRTGSDGGAFRDVPRAAVISIHAPRTGSDTTAGRAFTRQRISIHAPRTGSDPARTCGWSASAISIHAPRTGSDNQPRMKTCRIDISIHAPRTGSDRGNPAFRPSYRNFNPRSPHGERPTRIRARRKSQRISIHAPRTGSDWERYATDLHNKYFNPRSPHGERLKDNRIIDMSLKFQSTLPARGATVLLLHSHRVLYISIHAPRTGSDSRKFPTAYGNGGISIHAPRTGSDGNGLSLTAVTCAFQSTLPARGATDGERTRPIFDGFQSTLPARGATCVKNQPTEHPEISIHAPRTGSDWQWCLRRIRAVGFQSTLPARGATQDDFRRDVPCDISIHAPRTGSDADLRCGFIRYAISIHAPRTGSDRRQLNERKHD